MIAYLLLKLTSWRRRRECDPWMWKIVFFFDVFCFKLNMVAQIYFPWDSIHGNSQWSVTPILIGALSIGYFNCMFIKRYRKYIKEMYLYGTEDDEWKLQFQLSPNCVILTLSISNWGIWAWISNNNLWVLICEYPSQLVTCIVQIK